MRRWDVLVVGGGVAGLVAAAFASRAGAKVLLLEGAPTFGGRAKTRVVAGYHFNQGAHALYRNGFLDGALQDLGVKVTGNPPDFGSGFFVEGSTLHRAPFSAAAIASTTLLDDAGKNELASLLRRLVSDPLDVAPGTPLNAALAALSSSPRVRSVIATMVRLTSIVHAPAAADGRALLDQLRGALTRKALYLDGGWSTIVDGLQAVCLRLGVALRPGIRVDRVTQDSCWRAALSDGAVEAAQAAILAVNPAQAVALHPGLEQASGLAEPVAARVVCLDVGLSALPRPDALTALAVDRPLYLSVHSAVARLAPQGGALVHTMRYLEPAERVDRHGLKAELEGFLDLVQPGWRSLERARQFLPAMPAMSAIPLAAGGGLPGRPATAAGNAAGLFLAGDWIGSTGLLSDAAAQSGRSAGEAAAAFASRQTG